MKDFFYAIQDLFVNVLFAPMDALRALELENWFAANSISWIFMIICFAAFVYWMKQLKTYRLKYTLHCFNRVFGVRLL